jgi:hypothetical protein
MRAYSEHARRHERSEEVLQVIGWTRNSQVATVTIQDFSASHEAYAASYVVQPRYPALVLYGIVKQCGDGDVLAASVFQDCSGDSQKTGDAGDSCSLPRLPAMYMGGIKQRPVESIRKSRCRFHMCSFQMKI